MDIKTRAEEALKNYEALVAQHSEKFENRSLTEEEKVEERALNADIDAALEEVRSLNARAEREVEAAELRNKVAGIQLSTKPASKSFGEELRSAIQNKKGLDVVGGRIPASMSEYRAAPIKGTAGGNYTNDDFVTAVMTAFAENTSVFRAGARILPTTSGENILAPVLANIAGAQTAAGVALPATADNTSKTLSAYKYGAVALIANELVEDTGVDFAELVAGMVGDNVSGVVNADFVVGTGSSEPQGITVGAGAGHTAAGAAAITEADLYSLYYSVKDSAKNRGVWFMHPATAAAIRALEGLWSTNPASDNPDLLLGRPVFTDSNMATMAASAKTVVFGDPKAYTVRVVRGLRVQYSDEYKFGDDVTAVKVVWRGDGVVTDPNALKVLTQAAS